MPYRGWKLESKIGIRIEPILLKSKLTQKFRRISTADFHLRVVWVRVGVGDTQHIQVGPELGTNMLQELQTLALVGLLVSTYYLTIGCRQIGASLPAESGNISEKVASATEVLDDIADLLNEALAGLPLASNPQTPSSPMEAILSGFITSMTKPPNHANPQPQEWEILQPEDTPQND